MNALATIKAHLSAERAGKARAAWSAWEPADASDAWLRDAVRLRLVRPAHPATPLALSSPWIVTVDEYVISALQLARAAHATPEAGIDLMGRAAHIAAVRRLGADAEAVLDEAQRRFGRPDLIAAIRGRLYRTLDRREEARALYVEHLASSDADELHLGYAELLYVVGDFAGAADRARRVVGDRFRCAALDLETTVWVAASHYERGLNSLEAALAFAPDGANAPARLVFRASLRARSDDLDGAREDLTLALTMLDTAEDEDLAEEEFDGGSSREQMRGYVAKRLEALDAATATSRRRELQAFPTVVQKWNYCGPAVIELCMRYAGLALDQDFIAEAVKKGDGTPPHELVAFMRQQGLEVRRIEATVDVVKAALDLGYPVILEDDYSSTRHVVVAIGYDERLGTLTVADPMSHAPRPLGIELRDRLAREHRFAGVAVMGRRADVTDAQRAAADGAGITERPYLALFDEAGRSDLSPVEALASPGAHEMMGIATLALDAEPNFPAAEATRIGAASNVLTFRSREFMGLAHHALESQPELAEVPLAIAHAAHQQGVSSVASAEAARAALLDPSDPRGWGQLGAALVGMGAERDAYAAFSRAISLRPNDASAVTSLAMLVTAEQARRAVENPPDEAGARPALAAAFGPEAGAPWQRLLLSDQAIADLGAHLTATAIHMDDGIAGASLAFATHAWLDRAWDDALGALEKATASAPGWPAPILRRVLIHEDRGDLEGLRADAEQLGRRGWTEPDLWVVAVSALRRAGLAREAADLASHAIAQVPEPSALLGLWVDARASVLRFQRDILDEATALGATLAGSPHGLNALATGLLQLGLDDVVVQAFDRLHRALPDQPNALFEYAKALRRTGADPETTRHAWSRLLEMVPWHVHTRMECAWATLAIDPRTAESLVQAQEGVDVLELRLAAAQARGDDEAAGEARHAFERALESPNAARDLAILHLDASRFARARAIALGGPPSPDNLDQFGAWVRLMHATGRSTEVLSRDDVVRPHLEHLGVAYHTARMDLAHPLVRDALDAVAASDVAEPARWARVRLALINGDTRAVVTHAMGDPALLSEAAEGLKDARGRREILDALSTVAPSSRAALAAWHSHALWGGQRDDAWHVARRLHDEFPAHHEAHERLAELYAADGHIVEALREADAATTAHPTCARAWESTAWAAALQGDWATAGTCAERAIGLSSGNTFLAPVIALAAAMAPEGFAQAVDTLGEWSPGGAHHGVVAACRARLAGTTSA